MKTLNVIAERLRAEAEKLEAGMRRNSAPLLREAAEEVERLEDLRDHYFDQAQRFNSDFEHQLARANGLATSLAPEGHKDCGYGCDSKYVINCNCSARSERCPRHKVSVV